MWDTLKDQASSENKGTKFSLPLKKIKQNETKNKIPQLVDPPCFCGGFSFYLGFKTMTKDDFV